MSTLGRTTERTPAAPSRAAPAGPAPAQHTQHAPPLSPRTSPSELAALLARSEEDAAARPPPEFVARLQREYGNRYTEEVLARFAVARGEGVPDPRPPTREQPRVTISHPDDALEREAKQVADHVAAGGSVAAATISSLDAGAGAPAQRAAATPRAPPKREGKPAAPSGSEKKKKAKGETPTPRPTAGSASAAKPVHRQNAGRGNEG